MQGADGGGVHGADGGEGVCMVLMVGRGCAWC